MFNKIVFSIITLFAFPTILLAKVYSFDELLELAHKNSIETEIVKTNLIETQAKIDQLRSSHFPQISATIGGEKIDIRSSDDFTSSNFVANLNVDYNLFQFGAVSKKIDALYGIKTSQQRFLNLSQREVYRKLKKIFTNGLHLKELHEILSNELKFNQDLKKQVNKRQIQGLVGKADVLEIDMRDATLKQKLLILSEELDHNKDLIRKIVLLPHDSPIELKGKIPHEHFSADPKELIQAAKKFNANYLKLISETKSQTLMLESSKFERLPQLNIRGTFGRPKFIDRLSNESNQNIIGLYLDIPIWDGGHRSAATQIEKAKLARKTLRSNKSSNDIVIEIIHRYEKMNNIHQQVDLAESNVKNGALYFSSVHEEYKKGVKNSIDLVSARDRLMNFKSELIIAKKDFIISKYELEEVAGVEFE